MPASSQRVLPSHLLWEELCKECIERVTKAGSKRCPTCKTENFLSYPNKGLQQSLYDFEVYCSHKSKGCEWRGELRELDKHLNSDPPADKSLEGCSFVVIKCPLNCEREVYRKDVKAHVGDNLLSHVTAHTTQIKWFEECIKKEHDVNAQLKKEKQHIEQRLKELEETLAKLYMTQQTTSKREFTMTGFEMHKREDDVWFSPPFFTHPSGYKMCFKVIANGDSDGKSTHLSVRICMMRGEFDSQLKWPFKGKITVQLLSQEDDDHHVKVISSEDEPASTMICRKVEGKEMSKRGWGISQFIPHTKLEPKYLKNDCIKLRLQQSQ